VAVLTPAEGCFRRNWAGRGDPAAGTVADHWWVPGLSGRGGPAGLRPSRCWARSPTY